MSSNHAIVPARQPAAFAAAAHLFRDYQAAIGIDLGFQGFEAELAGLPGAYAPPDGELLLAVTVNGAAEGCIALRRLNGGDSEIKRLYVAPAARGEALGRRLAVAIINSARQLNYRRVFLDTLPEMEAATALYRDLGFRACSPYGKAALDDALFFELDL